MLQTYKDSFSVLWSCEGAKFIFSTYMYTFFPSPMIFTRNHLQIPFYKLRKIGPILNIPKKSRQSKQDGNKWLAKIGRLHHCIYILEMGRSIGIGFGEYRFKFMVSGSVFFNRYFIIFKITKCYLCVLIY